MYHYEKGKSTLTWRKTIICGRFTEGKRKFEFPLLHSERYLESQWHRLAYAKCNPVLKGLLNHTKLAISAGCSFLNSLTTAIVSTLINKLASQHIMINHHVHRH